MAMQAEHDAELRDIAIIPVEFWQELKDDPHNPGKTVTVDMVKTVKKGQIGSETVWEVRRLMPRVVNGASRETIEWKVVGPAYEKWKVNEEFPVDGIALESWPGASKALVEAMKRLHIRTVEDFAEASDDVFRNVPIPDLRKRQESARQYLAGGDRKEVLAENAEMKETIEFLRSEVEELKALVNRQAAAQPKPAPEPMPEPEAEPDEELA